MQRVLQITYAPQGAAAQNHMLVFKFGGASVNSLDRIRQVASILSEHRGHPLVVVISAMGKTTNKLLAIASAAVALHIEGETVRMARIGLGGMAYRPWRSLEAENVLTGQPLTEANAQAAATAALRGAQTHGFNDYKPDLARRTLVRALLETKSLSVSQA